MKSFSLFTEKLAVKLASPAFLIASKVVYVKAIFPIMRRTTLGFQRAGQRDL